MVLDWLDWLALQIQSQRILSYLEFESSLACVLCRPGNYSEGYGPGLTERSSWGANGMDPIQSSPVQSNNITEYRLSPGRTFATPRREHYSDIASTNKVLRAMSWQSIVLENRASKGGLLSNRSINKRASKKTIARVA